MSVVGSAPSALLEREDHLAALRDAQARATAGHGVLVLLGGEAGAGKTTLVRRFCEDDDPARVLWGACDPLFTPRPLAPFADIAHDIGGELRGLVDGDAKPHQIAAAIAAAARASRGTVVVLEDLHWADQATLDVLSLLGRRAGSIPALLIATYRDDELHRFHPLRLLLGERRDGPVQRMRATSLSLGAVRSLADACGLDAEALFRTTAGNPFFVTEVLAAGLTEIPATVRDAVLARAARLTPPATALLEVVAVAGPQAEFWLLDSLVPETAAAVQECLDSGMLGAGPGGLAFRHELARMAVVESLPPHRRVALHRGILGKLADSPCTARDLARLADHAEAAGDGDAVLLFAPVAAAQAASSGAHREAAAQYARALRFAGDLPPRIRAGLLESRSDECYLTDQLAESVETIQQAVECYRVGGGRVDEGRALSKLSRRLHCLGRGVDAMVTGQEALHVLESLPPGRELAFAYSTMAMLHLNAERFEETLSWGRRALESGDRDVVADSLNNIGTIQLLAGMPRGARQLERSLALAQRLGMDAHIGRAFVHAGWAMTRTRAYELASWLDRGIGICEELGLDLWRLYLLAFRGRFHLDRGCWPAADSDVALVLGSAQSLPLISILGNSLLGLLRARRGEPGQWEPLDAALALQNGQRELQFRLPVAAARAEAAWLTGRPELIDEMTRDTLDIASQRHAAWAIGELAWWRRLAGIRETVTGAAGPYAAQLSGDGEGAARSWARRGCRYEAALALVESPDESQLRHALTAFQRLGALPAAGIVARRLRERGVRGLKRGPQQRTKEHPAHLTRREAEVLELIHHGASNTEIAARLFISEKTAQHHVSAVLRKLGVVSRGRAAAEAARRGLTGPR